MMYSYESKLYTPEEIAGKTFSEGSKPEPLFTLQEMKDCAQNAVDYQIKYGGASNPLDYFKQFI